MSGLNSSMGIDPMLQSILANSSGLGQMQNLMNAPVNGNYSVQNAGQPGSQMSSGGGMTSDPFSGDNWASGMGGVTGGSAPQGGGGGGYQGTPSTSVQFNGVTYPAGTTMGPNNQPIAANGVPASGSTMPAGTIASQTNPALANYSNLLNSMQQQASQAYTQRQQQYQGLQSSIMGPNGYLSQLGNQGNQQINQQLQNQTGAMGQNLTSRGLGNTTIQNTMNQGLQNNAQQQRQGLNEQVGLAKTGAAMNLFNANPSFNSQQYMSLLPQLGNLATAK